MTTQRPRQTRTDPAHGRTPYGGPRRPSRRPRTGPALVLCGALALAGCAGDPPPEASGAYPDIADSPSERPDVAPAREREQVAEGLRADRRADRYIEETGERRRSSEVRPPEFTPPPETAAPAETPPAARLDAGEQPPAPAASPVRRDLPAPEGAARSAAAVPAGTPVPGAFEPGAPPPLADPTAAARAVPDGPPPGAPMPRQTAPLVPPAGMAAAGPGAGPSAAPYGGGPIVVDSRGVTTLGPGGPLTTPGPYPVAGPTVAAAGPAAMAPAGAQPLSAYGPLGGARSQRVAVIYFGNGSAGLSGRDRQVLEQVAALQRQYGGVVRVVGHASSRTGAMDIARHKLVNFNISLARANRVADALMSAGVPGRFLYVGAVSDSQPVYYEIMPTGEAGNRRAEIYLDY